MLGTRPSILLNVSVACGRRVLVTTFFLLGIGCASAPRPPQFSIDEHPWSFRGVKGVRTTTDHFEIHTTINDEALRRLLPLFLESAHQNYVALIPAHPDRPRLRTYLFRTRGQWEQFARQHYPHRAKVYALLPAGGFTERNTCVAYYIRRVYTLSVLAHEGMHQYIGTHVPGRIPAWLNEGLACYNEAFDIRRGQPVFTPRHNTFRLNSLREALAADTLSALDDLLNTHAGKVIVQNQSRHTMTYYAQVWALVVFLRHGADGRYADRFDALLADLGKPAFRVRTRAARVAAPDPQHTRFGKAVFLAYISDDLPVFESQYRSYLQVLSGFR